MSESSGRGGSNLVRAGLLIYVPLGLLAFAWLCLRTGLTATISHVVGANVMRDVLLGLGVGLMLVGLTRVASALSARARRAEAVMADILGPLTLVECVLLALASGIAEELIFRGALQPLLGLWLTALIFGAAHVPMRRELIAWPFLAAAAGLLLGWMAIGDGSAGRADPRARDGECREPAVPGATARDASRT